MSSISNKISLTRKYFRSPFFLWEMHSIAKTLTLKCVSNEDEGWEPTALYQRPFTLSWKRRIVVTIDFHEPFGLFVKRLCSTRVNLFTSEFKCTTCFLQSLVSVTSHTQEGPERSLKSWRDVTSHVTFFPKTSNCEYCSERHFVRNKNPKYDLIDHQLFKLPSLSNSLPVCKPERAETRVTMNKVVRNFWQKLIFFLKRLWEAR